LSYLDTFNLVFPRHIPYPIHMHVSYVSQQFSEDIFIEYAGYNSLKNIL